MQRYDVALWRFWPSTFPDYTDYMQAEDALSAVIALMHLHHLEEVAHAAARIAGCPDVERWDYVFVPLGSLEEVLE